MAYFTKEQYSRKREYAAKVATGYKDILVNAGMSEEEADKLIKLSHKRHELHCASGAELRELFDELGTQYSVEITLIDEVNNLAHKYNLPTIPQQEIPEVDIDDDYDLIADYFGVSEEEVQKDYEESIGEYHQDILLEWEKAKNKTSHDIRIFFYYINKKYGTDFPDDLPDDL